jgi:AcrR family transcriptional regulator
MATRSERRDNTESAIIDAGLQLLAEGGAEALTIRGLARKLVLVPSALYRYVRNRDDLLNLLLTHARADLIEAVQAAHDAVPHHDLSGRWRAFARSLRSWSLAHRHEWLLIQRTALTGTAPTTENTYALHVLLLRLGADAEAAGMAPALLPRGTSAGMPGLPVMLAMAGVHVSEQTVLAGLAAWHLLDGSIYAEVLSLAGRELIDADTYFDAMVAVTTRMLVGQQGEGL